MSEESWGKIAYEAYRKASNEESKMPRFEKLSESAQKAWNAAAVAVRTVLVRKAFKIRG